TGSTGDGFDWLTAVGHTVVRPSPALVPVAVKEKWVADLMGISFANAKLTVLQAGLKREERTGKLLFTHFGLSGPLVLNMGRAIGDLLEAGPVTLSVDLYPKLDPGALDVMVLGILEANKNKLLKNATGELFAPRMADPLFRQAGIDGETPVYRFSKEQRLALVSAMKGFRLSASHLLGEEKAIVTSGGVELKEVDFRTMRSKVHDNLYLIGDILDFDRPSGGFSLQLCWTTGWIAGGAAGAQCALAE
ncbi:MAG TPA: aminoacetone oxidase family FAD-binding enzyme, partial [Candidatus Peribacteria bacterium]|nr:aminoacetone oxidase family FAD-binding enzyme [Candidatus Peribacteria bacterium]